jgi:type I restriction enzyme S subunit
MSSLVPEGWSNSPLQDICFFQEGPGLRIWQYRDSGTKFINIRCIQGGDINTSVAQHLSDEEVKEKYSHFLLNEGDYVLSSSGTIGRLALVKKHHLPLLLNTSVIRFRSIDETRLDGLFLRHFLQSKQFFDKISEQSQGSAQVNFGPTHLKVLDALLPPLPEQKKIASILTSVDEVIENTQKQIDKLQDLKKATMNELLTKGIGHTEFKDSELGRIPKSWEVTNLKDILKSIVDCEHKTAPYIEKSNFLVVRTSNVRDGRLLYEDMKFTTKDGFIEWTKRSVPTEIDILFTREAPAGESCLVPSNVKVCLGQRMVLLKTDSDKTNANFLSNYLQSELVKKFIYRMSIGTTVSRINIEDINRIPMPIVPIREQESIASIIESLDNQTVQMTLRLGKFQSLKKSLMQDLLTGKVRVTVN